MKNNNLWIIFIVTLSIAEIVAAAFWVSVYAVPALIAGKTFYGMTSILTAWIWAYWGFGHLNELKEDK